MNRYAEKTRVSLESSRAEIEKTLRKYGARNFAYLSSSARAMIGFEVNERFVRFELPMPDSGDAKYKRSPIQRRTRSAEQAYEAWEQDCRQRWRALALCIKAKLEACTSGITTFEAEFMAHIVMPGGDTFQRQAVRAIDSAYRDHADHIRLLPGV